jgi:beta-phosphoglucomutase family hydrolase
MQDSKQHYAIIWDMDGVLVNTGEYHYQAWKKTFAELDIPFSRNQFRAAFGMNNAGILEAICGQKLPPDQEQSISEFKEKLFREAVKGKAKLLHGVNNALKSFSEWNLKQAIASSAPPKNIEVLVKELRIGKYFDVIVSGHDIPGKPDPAVFLKAAQQLNVPPANCVVIEDAVAGVEGAKNAGMRCIAVTTTNTPEALSKADLIFDTLEDLKQSILFTLFDKSTATYG